jgi:hypothetical protein
MATSTSLPTSTSPPPPITEAVPALEGLRGEDIGKPKMPTNKVLVDNAMWHSVSFDFLVLVVLP